MDLDRLLDDEGSYLLVARAMVDELEEARVRINVEIESDARMRGAG